MGDVLHSYVPEGYTPSINWASVWFHCVCIGVTLSRRSSWLHLRCCWIRSPSVATCTTVATPPVQWRMTTTFSPLFTKCRVTQGAASPGGRTHHLCSQGSAKGGPTSASRIRHCPPSTSKTCLHLQRLHPPSASKTSLHSATGYQPRSRCCTLTPNLRQLLSFRYLTFTLMPIMQG